MTTEFKHDVIDRYESLFFDGCLGSNVLPNSFGYKNDWSPNYFGKTLTAVIDRQIVLAN